MSVEFKMKEAKFFFCRMHDKMFIRQKLLAHWLAYRNSGIFHKLSYVIKQLSRAGHLVSVVLQCSSKSSTFRPFSL